MYKIPELLAPAGGMEQLKAAVENGADAVYMGGKLFNARINAANFNNEEIEEAIEYAHLKGAKLYVTMNTLIKDRELSDALEYAASLYENGADALIIQDLGFAELVRKHIPDWKL
ncbi:MAG TPA: U32 family peptidase, partial [Anaerovoracaceae bacterium]|nr:U32 family peptidase [Anaerovoracaceae bacterium]